MPSPDIRNHFIALKICPNCCRKDAAPNRVMCPECAAKDSQRTREARIAAKAKGICYVCRCRPALPGLISCEPCHKRRQAHNLLYKRKTRRKKP